MTYKEDGRPDPEELLQWVTEKEKKAGRGRLKVFLGYTSGVGKSFRMLDEGRRRKERGQDVVVGALQRERQEDAARLLKEMELLSPGEALDVDAVLRRNPQVCLVDELARDNPPGRRNLKRWQDVEELLAAGITVITAVNVQHIEERQDAVEALTGRRPHETVPEAFLSSADEIVFVDVPPEVLRERREERKTEAGAGIDEKEQKVEIRHLSELRELTLLLAAELVDRQLEGTLRESGKECAWSASERILVCMAPHNDSLQMIQRGRRIADRFHGELFALYVTPDAEWSRLSAKDRATVQSGMAFARSLDARVDVVVNSDEVAAILEYAREHRVTQIFVGHSLRSRWRQMLSRGTLPRLIREAEGIDIRIFPNAVAA